MSNHKYRPYLSPPDLQEIIGSLKATSQNTRLIRYLEVFKIKIDAGVQAPAITTEPTIEQKLGFYTTSTELFVSSEDLHAQWLRDPSALSLLQIEKVQLYRYENNLMSPKQESAYEANLGIKL